MSVFVDNTVNSAVKTTPPPPITFEQSLQYLTNKVPTGSDFTTAFSYLESLYPTAEADLAAIHDSTSLKNYFYNKFADVNIGSTLKQDFVDDYKTALRVGADAGWNTLSVSDTQFANQFNSWFDNFLTNYFKRPNTSNGASIFNLMNIAVTTTATMTNNPLVIPQGTFVLPNYQEIFEAYFPNASPTSFQDNLVAYYNQQIATKGYFVPSSDFAGWVQTVQDNYSETVPGTFLGNSNLQPANFEKTQVLNDIFALIALMIGTMQNVASAQADRLRTLTTWQAAYTNSLQQIHTFVKSDNTFAANSDDTRNEINNTINFKNRNLAQTFQSTVGDDAKSLQSSINLSSDTVSQQASMATSIIQELNTLLNAIFK